MRHLFRAWKKIQQDLNQTLLICLDYDGTLTDIQPAPGEAQLPKRAKKILSQLSQNPDITLAVITGRSLKNIQQLVGLKNILYAGNHGFLIQGQGISYSKSFPQAAHKALEKLEKKFRRVLTEYRGVIIENKKPGISVHYRMAQKKDQAKIKKTFRMILEQLPQKKYLRVQKGKRILEALPGIIWDKGKAVLWILSCITAKKKRKIYPVYVGDDVTDTHAFLTLKNKGLTVFVGNQRISSADYRLSNVAQVHEFLKRVSNIKNTP